MQRTEHSISLKLFADPALIPLVQNTAEQAALAFKMPRERALCLVMAAEEILAYLAQVSPGAEIRMTVSPEGWCLRVDFSFMAAPSDLWVINLAAGREARAGQTVEHLGLLLASRMVDGFAVRLKGQSVHLQLRLDYPYPVIEPQPAQSGTVQGRVKIVDAPEPALIKEACAAVVNLYPLHLIDSACFMPGKVVDMVAAAATDMIVALDEQSQLAGMMSWRFPSQGSIGFSGPYIFAEGGEVAEQLEMHLLQRVGRSPAESLFSDLATEQLVCENFEPLGQVDFIQADGRTVPLNAWFRLLKEDTGAAVWCHPDIAKFLNQAYSDLCLMRTVRTVDSAGETLPERSVFSVQLRPELKEAVLRPMVVGNDAAQSLTHQVDALREDAYRNIFFHLDLAYGWQAALGGALMKNGFEPRLVLPRGGTGDVVVFQYA
jgi:hypothetical protein